MNTILEIIKPLTPMQYTADGSIDLTLDHPELGEIPYTLAADHPEFDAIESGNTISAYIAPPKTKRRVGEFRNFMKFFTEAERLAIVSSTQSNAQIKLWYDTAMGGAMFSLDHPETAKGLAALVAAGLIGEERKDEILAADFDTLL